MRSLTGLELTDLLLSMFPVLSCRRVPPHVMLLGHLTDAESQWAWRYCSDYCSFLCSNWLLMSAAASNPVSLNSTSKILSFQAISNWIMQYVTLWHWPCSLYNSWSDDSFMSCMSVHNTFLLPNSILWYRCSTVWTEWRHKAQWERSWWCHVVLDDPAVQAP